MTEMIIIRLPQEVIYQPLTVEILLEWSLFRDGKMLAKPHKKPLVELFDDMPEPFKRGGKANVAVLAPAECFLFASVEPPAGQTKYLQKAIPYLLEEQLAEPVEELHFAVFEKVKGQKVKGQQVPVGMVRKTLLQNWLDQFAKHQFNVTSVVPDMLCLPWWPDHWQLLLAGNRVMVRTGAYDGWCSAVGQLPIFLDASLEEYKAVVLDQSSKDQEKSAQESDADLAELDVLNTKASGSSLVINLACEQQNKVAGRVLDALKVEVAATTQDMNVEVVRQVLEMPVFEVLGAGLMKADAEKKLPNMLQGDYKSKFVRAPSKIRYQGFAWVASIWLACYLGLALAQGFYYDKQAKTVLAEAESIYRGIYPDEKRIVNLRAQLKTKLNANKGNQGANFLALLHPIGEQIAQMLAKDKQAVEINRVTFRQKSGVVQMELVFKSYPYVDELKGLIEQQGLVASIDGANKGSKDKIKARLKVSAS